MAEGEDLTNFSTVDQTNDPNFFVRFLDRGNALPAIQPSKRIMLRALALEHGQRALDVGCGLGDDVFAMAEQVGGDGRVTGIDLSEAMIEEARRRMSAGLNAEFRVGDVCKLDFPTGFFDAVRAERLLMHVPDAPAGLLEMVRVTKPGGRVCVFDLDWDTLVIDSPVKHVTRSVVLALSDRVKNGWIGRQLPRMFEAAGIRERCVEHQFLSFDFDFLGLLLGGFLREAEAEKRLDPAALKDWWAGLAGADATGTFSAGITAFIVSGRKS